MASVLPNVWHLRRVADTAAKSCSICHKPSSSVLITPNNKDFFYVCPVHLKDRNFCLPIIDAEEEAAKKKQEAMDREIEKLKKEYEEKQQRKSEREKDAKSKDDSKDKKDPSENNTKKADAENKDEKERDEKIDAIKKEQSTPLSDDSPRIFSLHKNFYQMRIDRLRNVEAAKRSRQRLQDPSFFPSVPSGDI